MNVPLIFERLRLETLGPLFLTYGLRCLGAILIAAAGWWISRSAERIARRALLTSPHMDLTVAGFLSNLLRYAALAVTLVLILQIIGVTATSLVAVIGASSLAIGLALQGTLSNMAAGVMLLLFRPFRIGDRIEVGGKGGIVRSLNLFSTELAASDRVQVLIPNGQVWGQALTNHSIYQSNVSAVSFKFTVLHGKDPDAVALALRGFLAGDSRVLKSPAPAIDIADISDAGAVLSVGFSTLDGDAAGARADAIRQALSGLAEPKQRPNQMRSAE